MPTIGTCGLCGGAVCTPGAWYGTTPPTPQCVSCKATPKNPHGPKIEMDGQQPKVTRDYIIIRKLR